MKQEWQRLKAQMTENFTLVNLTPAEVWKLEAIKQAGDEQLQEFAVNKTTIGDINDMYYTKRKLTEFIDSVINNSQAFTMEIV